MRALDNVHFLKRGVVNGDVDVFGRVTVPLVQTIVFALVVQHVVGKQARLHFAALFHVKPDVIGVKPDAASAVVRSGEVVQRLEVPGAGHRCQDLPVSQARLLRLAFRQQLVAEGEGSCGSRDTSVA